MGDNLLGQFSDAIENRGSTLNVSQNHMAVLEDLNKRMKVQEVYNTEENVM